MGKKLFKSRFDRPIFELLEMLFYLYKNAVDYISDLETTEGFILKRLRQYSTPDLQYDTEDFNYYDRISHLFMCIIAIDYPHFRNSFMNGEIKLFRKRLETVNNAEIKQELSETSEYLNELSQSEEFKKVKSVYSNQIQLVQNIILAILSKSRHAFKKLHSKNCRKYKLTIPFTFPLKLVANRKVEVINGKVSLSCGQWSEIFEPVFEFLLNIEVSLIENCYELKRKIYEEEDDRLRQLIRRCTNFLSGNISSLREVLKADEIDDESLYFPPCMAGLHQILRHSHRLSYDSRFQYTLFLKDIGLSVDENISFWEDEYSKPHAGSCCTHNWQENNKRYKYQIQHLYGLIGAHGLKTSHPCDKFIQELTPKMDGGCPFQHLTSEQLANAMPKCMTALPDVEDIFSDKSRKSPQKACAGYLNLLQKILNSQRNTYSERETNKPLYIVSPLQFYNIAKNFTNEL